MMRISSQQVFSGGINRLQELNSNLNNTQQQISTGKRVNKPSDDPVAAARILKLDQEVKRVETFQRNASLAENRLKQEESALASAIDIIQRVRELTVQAGNGALSVNDRQSISAELKERIDQLATITNTRDASGEYIFSGFEGSQPAFTQRPDGTWRYNGDEGQRVLEIDDGVRVAVSDHGKGIFVDVPKAVSVTASTSANGYVSDLRLTDEQALRTAFSPRVPDDLTVTVGAGGAVTVTDPSGNVLGAGTVGQELEVAGVTLTVNDAVNGDSFTIGINDRQSVFASIEALISGLDSINKSTAQGNAAYDALIAETLINLDNAQENILIKQTELGGRLNAVESTQAFLEDSALYSKEIRSELEDIDYAEAISNLSFQSFVLQAAQQSFAQVSRLSLFDRL